MLVWVEKCERERTAVTFPAQLVVFYGSHPQQRTMASVAQDPWEAGV